MKRVVVSQRVDTFHQGSESRDAIDQQLSRFVLACDALPFPIPNILEDSQINLWLASINPDMVLLSGGNDIGNCVYRDRCENRLLEWAVEHRIPVLGICRGMQYINHWFGGTLVSCEGHVCVRHDVSGEINQTVNSYHNFSVGNLAQEFHVLAVAKDNMIEAIKHDSLPIEGWMWHPEREVAFLSSDIDRFKFLMERK